MIMAEMSSISVIRRGSSKRKKVRFHRKLEPSVMEIVNDCEENNSIEKNVGDDESLADTFPQINVRPTIHWGPVLEGDSNSKEQINTDTEHFDALFARSNEPNSPPPPSHPRCFSSCSPTSILTSDDSPHPHAKSQPLLSSSKIKSSAEMVTDTSNRPSPVSSSSSLKTTSLNASTSSARNKRKNFSLTHGAQVFLQANSYQNEPLEPLERSCSYKRPQSIKKYRQKKKERETQQQTMFATANSSHQSNPIASSVNASNSTRKSIGPATARISATDLMMTDDPQDQWSNLKAQRSGRLGSLPLDQLQLPQTDADEEVYLVRQFHTTSKGFVNRGDSFKRSFKQSGSTSRRSSFRTNPNLNANDRTPSQEQDGNVSATISKEARTSNHSLTNSSGANLNGIVDSHFTENNSLVSSAIPLDDHDEEEDDDDDPLVERIQTADGRLQDIRVYQVYLVGTSGTGKCSLIRQFKTTEYRGIYDYSSSIDDDPDNTVSIMLDGIESRLHIIAMDIDVMKSKVTGDGIIVVYSITDRQSFQTSIQFIKNIRDHEMAEESNGPKILMPVILVGNKSDLVRKRSVTKEMARHAAFKYNCKFVETSAAINDKVDDLLAGTLKQIRLSEQTRNEQRRRLTVIAASFETNDSETAILTTNGSRKGSTVSTKTSKNVFAKFLNVFRKKPSRFPSDVENLNTPIR